MRGVLQRNSNRGTHASGCTSANRIHNHQRGSRLINNGAIDFLSGTKFLNSNAGQFFTHRDHHNFWIHCVSLKVSNSLSELSTQHESGVETGADQRNTGHSSGIFSSYILEVTAMEITENIPLAPLTTLKVGGPARFFVEANTIAEVTDA